MKSIKHTINCIWLGIEKLGSFTEGIDTDKKFIIHDLKCSVRDLNLALDSFEDARDAREKIVFLKQKIKILESKLSHSVAQSNALQNGIGKRDRQIAGLKLTIEKSLQIAELEAKARSLRNDLTEGKGVDRPCKPVMPEEHYQSALLEKSNKLSRYLFDAYGEFPLFEPLENKHKTTSPMSDCPKKREEALRGFPAISLPSKKRSHLFDW